MADINLTPVASRDLRGEEGMTLIELMMAIVILGILFAGTAVALISFSQASVSNERRVQSTATLNRLHEELQALPWDDAALYSEEVASLAITGLDQTTTPPEFDGEPIVLIAGPGCDRAVAGCGIAEIPHPHENPLFPAPIDGRAYEVYRFVTWASRAGAGSEDIKRFTTIVRWQVFGRTVEQRFDSERAPTPAETTTGTPSLQFLVSPTEVPLRAPLTATSPPTGTNDLPIELSADFTPLGPMVSAAVRFTSSSGLKTVPLTRELATQRFTGSIVPGAFLFEEGSLDVTVTGTSASQTFTATSTVTLGPPVAAPTGTPPAVGTPTVLPTPASRVVGRDPPTDNRLCSSLRLNVPVTGAEYRKDEAGNPTSVIATTVIANYTAWSGPRSVTLTPPSSLTSGAGTFTHEFAAKSDSPWRPTITTSVTDTFKVIAKNPTSAPSALVSSAPITFTYSTLSSRQC